MTTMIKLSIRGIKASLGRLILTMIAIIAGVGFVAGAFILADSLEDTFSQIFESANSTVDASIVVGDLVFGDDERTIPDTLTAEIAALPEVGEASPTVAVDTNEVFRPYLILDEDGNEVEPATGGPSISFSWDGEEVEDQITIADGVAPVGRDQVAIDSDYAELAGVSVGDRVNFATPNGQQEFELAGTIDFPITAGAVFVIFDFPTAQELYGKTGQVDSINVSRSPGTTVEEMITAIEQTIPEEAVVLNQAEVIEDQSAGFEQFISIFRNLLLAFAGIALFVSLFIIYNTFAILVNQRLQQIGMLRAIGATRAQIRMSVAIEALLVGIIGSAIGIGFGLLVALGIKGAFQAGGGFPETSTVLALRTIIVSLVVGILATLLSALLPAFLAGRVSPIAAMRNEAPSRSSLTRRITIGSVVLGIGLLLLALGLFGGSSVGTSGILTALAVGAIATFVGVAMLSVLFAGPFVNFLGRSPILGAALLSMGIALPTLMFTIGNGVPDSSFGWVGFTLKIFVSAVSVITGASILLGVARGGRAIGIGGSAAGLEGQLARQNAARAPQRTAATATALTIGIALVSTVGVIGESLKASFADTLDRAVQADLFIYDEATQSDFSGEFADQVEQVEGVGQVSRFRVNEVWIPQDPQIIDEIAAANGAEIDVEAYEAAQASGDVDPGDGGLDSGAGGLTDVDDLAAYNADTGETLLNFSVTDGSADGLLDGGILVFEDVAIDRDLKVGDSLQVVFPDSVAETMTVAGIFEDNSVLNSPWIVDLSIYEQHVEADDDSFVAASVAEGFDTDAVKTDVIAVADQYPGIVAQDTGEFLETQEGQIDQLISLINYLLGFALFVAFLGVINTIVLSVIERTREIGLLRAVGMTRQQTRSTIRWEAVIVCMFGAVLGIVLGILFAWAAVSAIPDDIIGTVAVPYESVLFAILAAALAGVIAALLPARRAAKLDVLDAISS